MPQIVLDGSAVKITFSLLDRLLSLEGNVTIPLAHIRNAYVADFEALALAWRERGTALEMGGDLKMDGIFRTPDGLVFADIEGDEQSDCLVIETAGERFSKIAVTPDKGVSANALAHEIMAALPDGGASEG